MEQLGEFLSKMSAQKFVIVRVIPELNMAKDVRVSDVRKSMCRL